MKNRILNLVCLAGVMAVLGLAPQVWAEESEPQVAEYDDHNNRDPFWPLINSSGIIVTYDNDLAISDLVLEGITSDPSGLNLAIINGRIVEPGGNIGLFSVVTIEKSRVILRKDEQTFELHLKRED